MVKVLFDHQIFSMQRFGGISRYFANIHTGIKKNGEISSELGVLHAKNHYLAEHDFALSSNVSKLLFKKEKRINKWNKWYSQYLIRKNNFDIFHPTYYDPYFLSEIKKPFILTVHDMIHELFPKYFTNNDPFAHYKRLLIEKASHLIAISESTKADLQNIYSIPDEKISVVHHGYIENLETSTPCGLDIYPKNCILYVGERSGYKNFFKFISAIKPVLDKHPSINVICAGGGALGSAEYEFIFRKKLTSRIKQLGTSDGQLKYLYQNSLLFAYPSLYEGFGLPLLEAFANKCPVVASNTSCFREVAGNAAIYFNPSDEDDIQQKISDLIEDVELRSRLIIAGEKQLQKFSFEKCLKKTQEIYHSLAK